MNYQDTIDYLFQKLPIYQRSGNIAYKADIGNIVEACHILGNPHLKTNPGTSEKSTPHPTCRRSGIDKRSPVVVARSFIKRFTV